MQKSKAYLGTLELLSEPTVTVSLPTTIRLRCTAGIYGVDENGSLRLAWRTVSDFEQPQFTDPAGFGYTTISTSAHACIEAADPCTSDRFITASISGFATEIFAWGIRLILFWAIHRRAARESAHRVLPKPGMSLS